MTNTSNGQVKAVLMNITPSMAVEFLKKNTRNRTLMPRVVKSLATEMEAGRWTLTGASIQFAGNYEVLIDGQHRLSACVQSGITLTAVVVTGLDAAAFINTDNGVRRTTGQALSLDGEVNAVRLGGSVHKLHRYLTGRHFLPDRFTVMETRELLEAYPDIRNSLAFTGRYKTNLLAPSVMDACHYLFTEKDELAADVFIEQLVDGANLPKTDPVHVLRNRLIENAMSKAKLSTEHIMCLVIKAWNLRRKGSPCALLRFVQDGPGAEQVPAVR